MAYTPTMDDVNEWSAGIPSANASPVHPVNSLTSQQQPGILSQVASSPGVQFTLGAGDALRNTLASSLGLLQKIPGVGNVIPNALTSPVTTGQGGAYTAGDIAGNIAGFMGGGEVADTARAASEGLPYVGRLAQALGGQSWLPTAARQAGGSALYGALSTNDNRIGNAGVGGALSLATSTLPGAAQLGVKGAQYFMPQKFLDNMLEKMGGGQSLQDATKSVLGSIQNAYQTAKENSSAIYGPVFSTVADSPIYAKISKPNPLMSTDATSGYTGYYKPSEYNMVSGSYDGAYPNLSQSLFDHYSSTLKDLHNNFMDNPTFQNAHDLQSYLGNELNLLSKSPQKTRDVRDEMNALSTARSSLKNDMNNFLTNKEDNYLPNPDVPSLAQQYTNASDDFSKNVTPYLNSPRILSIAKGDVTNIPPTSLAGIFKAPDDDMMKIVSDLPAGTMDKVLYTALGKDTPASNPITFLRHVGRMDEQGLGDYLSPDLQSQIDSLRNRVKMRSLLQSSSSGALGAMEGAKHGFGPALGLGMTAATFGSPFMNYLARRLPLDQIGSALSTAIQKMYPYARSGALSNTLNQSGAQ